MIILTVNTNYIPYLNHKDLVLYNNVNGFKKAYQKELHKLTYHLENSLIPELNMLGEEIQKYGEEDILEKYPQLTYIVQHYESINQEVYEWI